MSSASSNPADTQPKDQSQQPMHSSLFSSTHSPIHTLPFEITSQILHYAVTLAIDSFEDEAYVLGDGEPLTANAYYLGRVCAAWNAIFLSTPSLWTHIVAFVDTPHTAESLTISPLQQSLWRSFPLPISVYLRRKVKIPMSPDLEERHSTMALLVALKGHFGRVEALVVETYLASSLPNALNVLTGGSEVFPLPLRTLRSLVFRCNANDSTLHPSTPSAILRPVISPFLLHSSLTTLNLDGRNLLKMLRSSNYPNGSGFEDVFSTMLMLETLAVSNLTCFIDGFSEALVHYFFVDVVTSYPRLTTLALESLELGQGFRRLPTMTSSSLHSVFQPLVPASSPRLIFKNVERGCIEYVLTCIGPLHTVILAGCSLFSPSSSSSSTVLQLPNVPRLVIADLTIDVDRKLAELIARWNGEHLELIRCTCIDDGFWAALTKLSITLGGARTVSSTKDGCEMWNMEQDYPEDKKCREVPGPNHPRLRSLKVIDSPNFLPDSLLYFLRQLTHSSEFLRGRNLEHLVISGTKSPKLETDLQLEWARNLVSKKLEWQPLNVRY